MKKFILNTMLFLILLTVLIFLIDCIHISDEFVIEKTKGTSYDKIAWNLNLINYHPEKINGSIIFLGPSLMQGDICDSTLNANSIKAVNMGINHPGKEIELLFLNRILNYKPTKVFLHLSKYELTDLHPMTPLLYDPLSLLFNGQSLNIPFLFFLFHRAFFVSEFVLWSFIHPEISQYNYQDYGVVYQKSNFSNESYQAVDTSKILSPDFRKGDMRSYFRHYAIKINFIFNTGSQEEFVTKTYEYAKKNDVKISEIYLPTLIDAKVKKDFGNSFYSSHNKYIPISLKNFDFLDEAVNWTDLNHLSRKGAIRFTNELILQRVIQK